MEVTMSTTTQHISDLPHILVVRSCLRGNFIARDLSRLLILILLILSPLTFSNDNIPNFQPDGVSSYSISTKASRTVAVILPDASTSAVLTEALATTPQFPDSHPLISYRVSSQPSRAPPA
jgi:hypothetical protein